MGAVFFSNPSSGDVGRFNLTVRRSEDGGASCVQRSAQ